ncbi:unnamed protein product, partial [marine sediment metagenome]
LVRYWPERGAFGWLEDLGPLTQTRDTSIPMNTFLDHVGGLVFGPDGMLYCVVSRWEETALYRRPKGKRPAKGMLTRINPHNLESREVAQLSCNGVDIAYVTRGARDRHGDLFFGAIGIQPSGFMKVATGSPASKDGHLPLRMWG